MNRQEKVKQKSKELIDQGIKPSATTIAQELQWTTNDVHRCLNILEKNQEIQTYTKEVFGAKNRFVSVKRGE